MSSTPVISKPVALLPSLGKDVAASRTFRMA